MPLLPAKCTSCGATLTLDPAQDAAVCPFCNTPFIVEKAIHNYNTTNQYHTTQNITAENVIVQNSQQEELYQAGETFLSLGNEAQAGKRFSELAERYPGDVRGWWGLYRVFLFIPRPQWLIMSDDWRDPINALRSALQLASAGERAEMLRTARGNAETIRQRVAEAEKLLETCEAECSRIRAQGEKELAASEEARAYAQAQARCAQLNAAYAQCLKAAARQQLKQKSFFLDAIQYAAKLNPPAEKQRLRAEAELNAYRYGPLEQAKSRYLEKQKTLQLLADAQCVMPQHRAKAQNDLLKQYRPLLLAHEDALRPYAQE